MFGDRFAVGNDENRAAALSMVLEERKDLLLRRGVDFTGGLVGNENRRLGSERDGKAGARCFSRTVVMK